MMNAKQKLLLLFETDFFYAGIDSHNILLSFARNLSSFFDIALVSVRVSKKMDKVFDLKTVVENDILILNFWYKWSIFAVLNSFRRNSVLNAAFKILSNTWTNPDFVLIYSNYLQFKPLNSYSNSFVFLIPLNKTSFSGNSLIFNLPTSRLTLSKVDQKEIKSLDPNFFPFPNSISKDNCIDSATTETILVFFDANSSLSLQNIESVVCNLSSYFIGKIYISTNSGKIRRKLKKISDNSFQILEPEIVMSVPFSKAILIGDFRLILRLMIFFLGRRIKVMSFFDFIPDYLKLDYLSDYMKSLNSDTLENEIRQFILKENGHIDDEIIDRLYEDFASDYIAFRIKALVENII